jgi:hypothetical protein
VAESIVNRSKLPEGSKENPKGTIADVITTGYDVAKEQNRNYPIFNDPFTNANKNPKEQTSWRASMSASIKAISGVSNIGKGVIFYNSSNPNQWKGNPLVVRIILNQVVRGIAGLWKLKK